MNWTRCEKIVGSFDPRLIPPALAGLLLAAAFPPLGWGWLGFIALVPLLLFARQRPFASGFVCGVFFFAPLLYWLNIVMTTYGGLAPFFSAVAWLLLCVYLALFFGAATWTVSFLQQHCGLVPVTSLPFVWVALEYLRGWLFTGFPWGLSGYAAIDMPTLRQAADIFGVYGLSFLFVLINAVVAALIQKQRSRQLVGAVFCALLLLGGALGYGTVYELPSATEANQLTVGLAQGNVAQAHKWDRNYRQQTIDRYRALSRDAARQGAELLIWPEAATPFYLQDDSADSRQVREIAAATGRFLMLGGPSYRAREDGSYLYHNSAYLLDAQGKTLGRSDKIHLVPFGEYVPLGRLLFFVKKLVVGVGDFTPGRVEPLAMNGHDLGVLICYEAIFPALARDYVRKGSDLLVNLTNDAWFGRSSAPRQLLDMTRMRAIENRIWIARAANTGISALISPDGSTQVETGLFRLEAAVGPVALGSPGSLYQRFGDLLPLSCLIFTLSALLLSRMRRKPLESPSA